MKICTKNYKFHRMRENHKINTYNFQSLEFIRIQGVGT